jgi:hypothetical protein
MTNRFHRVTRAPRTPFKGSARPIMSVSRHDRLWLSQVSQVCHKQNLSACDTLLFNIIDDSNAVTGETGKNQPITHARARFNSSLFFSPFSFLFCNYILIIIKSACFTCDSSDIVNLSPVTVACDTLFHL